MSFETESIQPGWKVVDAHGDEIGTVVNAESGELIVKKGGLLGGEVHVPVGTIAEVETGRVEINRTKGEL